MKTFIITISRSVQIGEHEYSQYRIGNIFSADTSITTLVEWAKDNGFEDPQITEFVFSNHEEFSSGGELL